MPLAVAIALLVGAVTIALLLWEYAARTIPGFAAEHSHPTEIWFYLTESEYVWNDLLRLEYTALRGGVGMLIAFIIAYPLGALIPILFDRITNLTRIIILSALWFPHLPLFLFVKETVGYNQTAVYVIGLWTACSTMLTFGFTQARRLVTDDGSDGEILEAAVVDGAGRWQLYWFIVLPLLRNHHIDNLAILAPRVWSGITFAEAIILANVIGLGERMVTTSEYSSTFGHFYAVTIYLILLEINTYVLIYSFPRMWRLVLSTLRIR